MAKFKVVKTKLGYVVRTTDKDTDASDYFETSDEAELMCDEFNRED